MIRAANLHAYRRAVLAASTRSRRGRESLLQAALWGARHRQAMEREERREHVALEGRLGDVLAGRAREARSG